MSDQESCGAAFPKPNDPFLLFHHKEEKKLQTMCWNEWNRKKTDSGVDKAGLKDQNKYSEKVFDKLYTLRSGMDGWMDGWMDGRKEGRKEGRREGGREGGMEGRKEGGREGRREGGREGRKEGGREGRWGSRGLMDSESDL